MSAIRVALVPIALGFLVPGDAELAYGVAPGTTLVRTWSTESAMELEDLEFVMNGEDVSEEAEGMDVRVHVETRLTVTDTLEESGAGQPQRLRRTFDEIGGSEVFTYELDGDSEEDASEYESELEGLSVRFTWDADEDEYAVAFTDEEDGDDELLAPLVEDMDLRAFLPGQPVSPGDSWEIEGAAFQHVLDPGGDLGIERVDEEEDEEGDEQRAAELRDNLTASITATYAGTVEEDGRELARIELAIEARSNGSGEVGLEDVGSGTRSLELEWVLAGELFWDLEHGHAALLELSGEHTFVIRESMTVELDDTRTEQEQVLHLRGDVSYSMSCERR